MRHIVCARGAVLLVGLSMVAVVSHAEIIEQILVKVNGEVFTKTDLENRQVLKLRELQGEKFDLKTAGNDQELRKMLDQITPALLIEALDEMLVVQRGKEIGFAVPEAQITTLLQDIRAKNKLETEEAFQAALNQEGLTVAELRRNLERQMIWQRVQQNEVVNKVAMTDEEARAYYDSHLQEFTTPAAVTLREILVGAPTDPRGINVGADEAAQVRAEAIRARVLAGEAFDKLATDLSESPSRANAGLIGPINLDDLSADLRKIIEAMKVGEVTEPLRTARGYQILKLESSTVNQVAAFEQARDRIANSVLTEKRRREFAKYLEKLHAQAIIEWKNPDVEKAYQEGRAQQAAAAATPSLQR